ncbi:helix-turn-helix domain-containing protein [Stutzerimonas nitrititolerans]|uniref:helix-turn-helix domain-containing protein n=1 Tax=Stutzerimonas nitrititolerans TaxID=2482751 RepID=UPI0028ADC875|nr:helix-turn-helix domain-containing protein [Stutzerimonas nitrititolerans]
MNIAEKPLDLDQMPSDPAQRWEWIKYQLRIHGCPPAELARQLGITDRAIRAVKRTPYPRIERAIALKLGVEPMQLWPERWNQDGSPNRRRPNRAESTVSYHSTEQAKNSGYVPVSHRITARRG